jgi:type III pantothenate kinase
MLLAIDVGNTQTVFGLWDGSNWIASWRRATRSDETEDELAAWLRALFDLKGFPWVVDGAICGSVVPGINRSLTLLAERWFGVPLYFLRTGADVGLPVDYDPPHAVGADRLANALGALEIFRAPIIVVDFGTATTFDTISADSVYVGGAILPGIQVAADALTGRTAKLPSIELVAPSRAIGHTTVESLQSGLMLGYAGAIDALARRINAELGGNATIISTGGLGKTFLGICETISSHEADLTLDGLRIAFDRMTA